MLWSTSERFIVGVQLRRVKFTRYTAAWLSVFLGGTFIDELFRHSSAPEFFYGRTYRADKIFLFHYSFAGANRLVTIGSRDGRHTLLSTLGCSKRMALVCQNSQISSSFTL